MNWSINAEWYDADKNLPPADEEVLCAVKSSELVWDEVMQRFKREPLVLMYVGSRDSYGWYFDGLYIKPRANVQYWTWLPKPPKVVNKDE